MTIRKLLLATAVVAGAVSIGLVAGRAEASAPGASLTVYNGAHQGAPVAPTVSPGLTTTTYTFSTSTSPINGTWNQGWWSLDETNSNANTNYFTGHLAGPVDSDRGYFTFDISAWLSGACAPISGYLSVPTGEGNQAAGAGGPTFVSAALFDVATSPITLAAKVNNPNAAIYGDLGSGTLFGGPYTLSTAVSFGTFMLNLNANAFNALLLAHQNHVQFVSIGTTLINPPAGNVFLYGFTGYAPVTLTVTVPKLCKVSP
jgi:hypothetical protein